jgi:hypothetical protein
MKGSWMIAKWETQKWNDREKPLSYYKLCIAEEKNSTKWDASVRRKGEDIQMGRIRTKH